MKEHGQDLVFSVILNYCYIKNILMTSMKLKIHLNKLMKKRVGRESRIRNKLMKALYLYILHLLHFYI